MDNTFGVARDDCLDHLAEEISRQLLLQHPLLGDVVEEVLAGGGLLHHVDEGIDAFVEVDQADNARNALYLREQFQLQRNSSTV